MQLPYKPRARAALQTHLEGRARTASDHRSEYCMIACPLVTNASIVTRVVSHGVSITVPVSMDEAAIKEAAVEVFEWLHTYQSAGGLPFVSHVFHRSVQCFRKHGESQHATGKGPVSKETFIAAVVSRHGQGSGIVTESESKSSIDVETAE